MENYVAVPRIAEVLGKIQLSKIKIGARTKVNSF